MEWAFYLPENWNVFVHGISPAHQQELLRFPVSESAQFVWTLSQFFSLASKELISLRNVHNLPRNGLDSIGFQVRF